MNHRERVAIFFTLGATFACGACGGAAGDGDLYPRAPRHESNVEESDPTTIEEAQARIARARVMLGDSAAEGAPSDVTKSMPAPTTPAPLAEKKQADRQDDAESERGAGCRTSCRALASMRRATAALCRMTGNDDARCVDAKRTLAGSELRVLPCTC